MIGPITYDRFLDDIQRRAALRDREAARRIVAATLETLGQRIAHHEAALLADSLPEPFDDALCDTVFESRFDVDELYDRVATRARLPLDRAREQVQVVCERIGAIASEEALAHLDDLPEDLAVLFRPRAIEPPPDSPRELERRPPATLATGDFGAGRSLSEAGPDDLVHPDSIAHSGTPREDRKISSGRPDDTLATGKPGREH